MRDLLKTICRPASREPCPPKEIPVRTLFIPPLNKHETLESPCPSPQRLEHGIAHTAPQTDSQTSPVDKPHTNPISANNSSSSSALQLKPHRSDSSGTLMGPKVKVALDDATFKDLSAILKKFKIRHDNWRNYAISIMLRCSWSLMDGHATAEKGYARHPLMCKGVAGGPTRPNRHRAR
jgi:hypothetical protein